MLEWTWAYAHTYTYTLIGPAGMMRVNLQGEPNKNTLRKLAKVIPPTWWWSSNLGLPKADGAQESAFQTSSSGVSKRGGCGMAPHRGTATAIKEVFCVWACAACTWTWVHTYTYECACSVAWNRPGVRVLTELLSFQEVETDFKCHHILMRSSECLVGKWDGTETVVWVMELHPHCFISSYF